MPFELDEAFEHVTTCLDTLEDHMEATAYREMLTMVADDVTERLDRIRQERDR